MKNYKVRIRAARAVLSAFIILNSSLLISAQTALYFDAVNGKNWPTNNGLSQSTAWQDDPDSTNGFANRAGWVRHDGDSHIFKGGVTNARSSSFPIHPPSAGTNSNIYYGTNGSWGSGYAVFDAQYMANGIFQSDGISHIYLKGIEMRNVLCDADNQGLVTYWQASYLTGRNLWLHGWLSTGTLPGSDTAHGGWIGFNANTGWGFTNIMLADSEIDNIENGASGKWNGVCVMYGGVLTNCLIHDSGSAILFAQDVNHCTVYNIDTPYFEYDSDYHENGFYMDGANWTSPIKAGIHTYCRNTIFHDIGAGANMAYPNIETFDCYVYNCLFYGVMSAQQAVNIDTFAHNFIPSETVYSGGGAYTVTGLTSGLQYSWTPQSGNDTSCAGLTSAGVFTAIGSTQILNGTPGQGVTANIDPVIQGNCHIYNNTMVLYGNTWTSGINIANRPFLKANDVFITNNLFIGVSAAVPPSGSAFNVVNQQAGNNVALTPGAAGADGYTLANLYQPVSAFLPTVGAGANLASLGLFQADYYGNPNPASPTNWNIGYANYVGPTNAPSPFQGVTIIGRAGAPVAITGRASAPITVKAQ